MQRAKEEGGRRRRRRGTGRKSITLDTIVKLPNYNSVFNRDNNDIKKTALVGRRLGIVYTGFVLSLSIFALDSKCITLSNRVQWCMRANYSLINKHVS